MKKETIKLTILTILSVLGLVFIIVFMLPIPFTAKETCLKKIEQSYTVECCENVSDIDGDGYVLLNENGLGYGDFSQVNWYRCRCSGYHPDRAVFACDKTIFKMVFE